MMSDKKVSNVTSPPRKLSYMYSVKCRSNKDVRHRFRFRARLRVRVRLSKLYLTKFYKLFTIQCVEFFVLCVINS